MQKGLSNSEAEKLLEKYGENVLSSNKHESAAKIFASQFKDLLTLILLVAAAISVFLGEFIDAFTVMAIVFINAIIGFSQEYKTERTIENLKELASPKANVFRDGKKTELPTSKIVPGDIALLSAGCKVPADGKLLSALSMTADESMLTGESIPIEKKASSDNPDFSNVYMGTSITSGHGAFLVTATGMETQMGKIASMLKESKNEQTPLQQKLAVLSKYIAAGCLIICVIVTITGILRGEPAFDMFLTGLSLSVAAIPEGLTAVITISLGLAVNRMLKRNALIRKLHSVETLGCANVICSDKTGTLTENCMTVTEIFLPNRATLYPKDFQKNESLLKLPFLGVCLCNNAEIIDAQKIDGEPTEAALMKTVLEFGKSVLLESKNYVRTDEIPFDSNRKLMSVAVKSKDHGNFIFIKGAPDMLLPLCSEKLVNNEHQPLSQSDRDFIKNQLSKMAASALRVIAVGYKRQDSKKITENSITFLGLFGMIDPPRKDAANSVLKCKKAGIRTIMITGDHPETAFAIAKKLCLAEDKTEVITGNELDKLSEKEFSKICEHRNVFARVTPAHKLKIVRALKKSGNVVAMTGDGVNDAPAVKEADIGVSMGKNGTDVTREASGIVLLNDDFSTLVAVVQEGRIIYGNIRKFIRYLLSCNIGEVVTMFFGMLMGMPVVLLPTQILMVNLVTDGIPAIALGFDPPQDDVMLEKPRKRDESVFANGLGLTIITRGFLLGLSVLGAFTTVLRTTSDINSARTAAFVSLVFTQLVHVFECKSESRSLFTIKLFNNLKLVFAVISSAAIVLSTVYIPTLNPIFKTVPLDKNSMLTVLIFTFAVPLISGIISLFRKKR